MICGRFLEGLLWRKIASSHPVSTSMPISKLSCLFSMMMILSKNKRTMETERRLQKISSLKPKAKKSEPVSWVIITNNSQQLQLLSRFQGLLLTRRKVSRRSNRAVGWKIRLRQICVNIRNFGQDCLLRMVTRYLDRRWGVCSVNQRTVKNCLKFGSYAIQHTRAISPKVNYIFSFSWWSSKASLFPPL